jgi:hypothetical protein
MRINLKAVAARNKRKFIPSSTGCPKPLRSMMILIKIRNQSKVSLDKVYFQRLLKSIKRVYYRECNLR